MTFEDALAAARARPSDQRTLELLASEALRCGEEDAALPLIDAVVRAEPTARLWQWKALLERALDRHGDALASFEAATGLAPADAGIAHGLGRTALEAGLPAERRFERALELAPGDGQILIGLIAARLPPAGMVREPSRSFHERWKDRRAGLRGICSLRSCGRCWAPAGPRSRSSGH